MAQEYPDFEFVQEVLAQITWYHNVILMDKIKDINKPIGISEYKLLED